MGSETMGSLVMAQISNQAEIIQPEWTTICRDKSEWIDIPTDNPTTKSCN